MLCVMTAGVRTITRLLGNACCSSAFRGLFPPVKSKVCQLPTLVPISKGRSPSSHAVSSVSAFHAADYMKVIRIEDQARSYCCGFHGFTCAVSYAPASRFGHRSCRNICFDCSQPAP